MFKNPTIPELIIMLAAFITVAALFYVYDGKIPIKPMVIEPERIVRKLGCDGKPLVWWSDKESMKYQTIYPGE